MRIGILLLAGCSFFATEAPRPTGPTRCNRSMSPVITDAIAAAAAAFAAGVSRAENAQGANVIVPLGVAGVFGASSGYGYWHVHGCRVEHDKRPMWSLDDMPAVM